MSCKFSPMPLHYVCVFCGSSSGSDPAFSLLATELGKILAHAKIGLVYGGASVGLMGKVADAVLENEGEVIGVIPEGLQSHELNHKGLTELLITKDMHQRKRIMYERSDGFIALPGGMGTLEEVFEAATWTKLGFHKDARNKPVILLGSSSFWSSLNSFLDMLVDTGFIKESDRGIISYEQDPSEAVRKLASHFVAE
jgi:uncharacterized protein (TIGR00730 family)